MLVRDLPFVYRSGDCYSFFAVLSLARLYLDQVELSIKMDVCFGGGRVKASKIFRLFGVFCLSSAPMVYGAQVFTQAGLSSNDSVNWSQLGGPSGPYYGSTFSATSANGVSVKGSDYFSPSYSYTLNSIDLVCPATNCNYNPGWTSPPPSTEHGAFLTGDSLFQTAYQTGPGNGPLYFYLGNSVSAGGAYIQSFSVGQFTAEIDACSIAVYAPQATCTGGFTYTVTSDAAGDPVFLGFSDTSADINEINFSLTSITPDGTGSDQYNFAIDSLYLTEPATAAVPEPATVIFMLLGVLLVSGFRRLQTATAKR